MKLTEDVVRQYMNRYKSSVGNELLLALSKDGYSFPAHRLRYFCKKIRRKEYPDVPCNVSLVGKIERL